VKVGVNGCTWHKLQSSGRMLWESCCAFRSHKRRGIS